MKLWWVSCDVDDTGIGPTHGRVLVVAEDAHDALDKAPEHPEANSLYDEEMARAQADGKEPTRQQRQLVKEAQYVGDVENLDSVGGGRDE